MKNHQVQCWQSSTSVYIKFDRLLFNLVNNMNKYIRMIQISFLCLLVNQVLLLHTFVKDLKVFACQVDWFVESVEMLLFVCLFDQTAMLSASNEDGILEDVSRVNARRTVFIVEPTHQISVAILIELNCFIRQFDKYFHIYSRQCLLLAITYFQHSSLLFYHHLQLIRQITTTTLFVSTLHHQM